MAVICPENGMAMLKRADIIRKACFLSYAVRPFRAEMIAHQVFGRLKSAIGPGSGFRIIDLAITGECNLSCRHCSAALLNQGVETLSLPDYREIVKQGKRLDNLSWNITGGEPLMVDWLDDLIPVLEPNRHYISLQTNAWLLTSKRAGQLAALGVNCITTSLDSAVERLHDGFRGRTGSYRKVFEGIRHARAAGMRTLVGATITHDFLYSSDLIRLIEKVNSAGALFLFNLAVPCGRWRERTDIILTPVDRRRLGRLMDRYPRSSTDHEVGRNRIGCPAGMEKIYITAGGEVLPCPFIQVSFGNCRSESLADIVHRMRRVPEFNCYQPICVAAEDRIFQDNVFPKIYGGEQSACPISYREIYGCL